MSEFKVSNGFNLHTLGSLLEKVTSIFYSHLLMMKTFLNRPRLTIKAAFDSLNSSAYFCYLLDSTLLKDYFHKVTDNIQNVLFFPNLVSTWYHVIFKTIIGLILDSSLSEMCLVGDLNVKDTCVMQVTAV